MPDALIITDMERGFMSPEGSLYCGDAARAIIPNVAALVERAKAAGDLVVFIADTHQPNDKEFRMWPPHCLAGTPESEIIPELSGLAAGRPLLRKRRYSAFFETDLAERLAVFKPEQVIVTGVCTDICVLHTATEARARDYEVWAPSDCVASFDEEGHAWALRYMEKILGAKTEPAFEQSSQRGQAVHI